MEADDRSSFSLQREVLDGDDEQSARDEECRREAVGAEGELAEPDADEQSTAPLLDRLPERFSEAVD